MHISHTPLLHQATVAVAVHAGEQEARLFHLVLFEPRIAVGAGEQHLDPSLEGQFGQKLWQGCISSVADATL